MLRFYLRLILLLIPILTGTLLVIHAQPYDDHDLHQLLLPESCPAPCFMGIRPGVTTQDEAIKILEDNPWVEVDAIHAMPTLPDFPLILKWKGNQPAMLNEDEGFGLSITFQNSHPKTVAQISFNLNTDIRIGDLYLMLGKSTLYRKVLLSSPKTYNMVVSHRFHNQISFLTITNCPIAYDSYWSLPSAVIYMGKSDDDMFPTTLRSLLHEPPCN
jgi:hypothetical protein